MYHHSQLFDRFNHPACVLAAPLHYLSLLHPLLLQHGSIQSHTDTAAREARIQIFDSPAGPRTRQVSASAVRAQSLARRPQRGPVASFRFRLGGCRRPPGLERTASAVFAQAYSTRPSVLKPANWPVASNALQYLRLPQRGKPLRRGLAKLPNPKLPNLLVTNASHPPSLQLDRTHLRPSPQALAQRRARLKESPPPGLVKMLRVCPNYPLHWKL